MFLYHRNNMGKVPTFLNDKEFLRYEAASKNNTWANVYEFEEVLVMILSEIWASVTYFLKWQVTGMWY